MGPRPRLRPQPDTVIGVMVRPDKNSPRRRDRASVATPTLARTTPCRSIILLDLLAILVISFVAETVHFSYQQGRAVISGDSAQYVASAEALLDPDGTPHFEMRKPGYILFLAGVALCSGNMGWAAVVANHALLAALPIAAYGFGLHLRNRFAGWLAAVLVIVRLQGEVYGDRVMSEALYAWLLSFGLLALAAGLSRRAAGRWMAVAGLTLGLAWLTRGTASLVIVIAVGGVILAHRSEWRRAAGLSACFLAPVAACFLLECGLNLRYAGRFRPSNGTIGATLLLRARHFEGFDWPTQVRAEPVLAFLPERHTRDAYVADHLDVWVARYRAIHNHGMTDWTYDDLMRRVGGAMLRENTGAYVRSSLRLAWRHLVRNPDGQGWSPVHAERRGGPIHPTVGASSAPRVNLDIDDWDNNWFIYYGLPHLPPAEAASLVARTKTAAATRAPFGDSDVWRAFRYWKTKPVAATALSIAAWVGSLWPGFALIGCAWLGLRRRTCVLLAVLYAADALALGFVTPTTARLQFVWIVSDTALAAAFWAGAASVVIGWARHSRPEG